MAKTYAAFYLPPEEKEIKQPNQKNVDRTANSLSGTLKNLSEIKSQVDVKEMAKNIDLQSTTEFVQRYAVGALTKIINGEAVTNKTMLDSLFNTYAPALNAGLAQTGFNSLVELKNAVETGNGNVNVANFVQGFSNGLSIVQAATEKVDYSKYGEEIPIDVVDKITSTYQRNVATQKDVKTPDKKEYIDQLNPVEYCLFCHVQNKNAEYWAINDIYHKILDCLNKKTPLICRLGKNIYENCIIKYFNPQITTTYDFYFEIRFEYDFQYGINSFENENGVRVLNANPNNKTLKNAFAKEVYMGIIKA